MASIPIRVLPEAGPAAEPWPADEFAVRADEMFARRLDTEFAAGVRDLLHNPETGLSSLSGEAALEAIAGVYPALEELRQRTLDGAMGTRQRGLLEPLMNTRLDWAAGTIGRLAERATAQVDDESVAERLTGLGQDAAASWDDPAHLQKLGRAAVEELRWQGERRGWDATETDARAKAGLSDLYAGAVQAAMGRDIDGATSLLAHAREAIDPAWLETIDHRLARAREDGFLREVDAALSALPLAPAAPPALEAISEHIAGLTPGDATEHVRGRIGELAVHAQRRAERQWHRQQAEAGVAALDWLKQNPDASSLFLPEEVREWLAADQLDGLMTLEQRGRLVTDPDLFERLDWQSVYEPEAFAALDLDRHRLSLDDRDHARFAATQKAMAKNTTDPVIARQRLARIGVDRALASQGIDTESTEAADIRADMRDRLDDFEIVEGRPPNGQDIEGLVEEEAARAGHVAKAGQTEEPRSGESVAGDRAGDPNIVLAGGGGGSSSRRSGGPPLTPFEQMRAANFRSALDAIRQLEPNNRELSYVAPRGWVPSDRDVARIREELAGAQQRVAASGAAPSTGNEPRTSREAFHYTFERVRPLIEAKGLKPGSYATTTDSLSPLQAHIDLALPPNRGLPGVIFRIDLNGLRAAGYEVPQPTPVGRSYGMPGGGHEMKFPYSIPPQYLKVIK